MAISKVVTSLVAIGMFGAAIAQEEAPEALFVRMGGG